MKHRIHFIVLSFIVFNIISCNTGNKNHEKITGSIDTLSENDRSNSYVSNDQSPMDMSYYPPDFPVLKMKGSINNFGLIVRVIYSRPQKNGRVIFGTSPVALCQYGKEWRLGANEATEIEFFKEVSINGKKIVPGRYVIYCIPEADKWTIILNNNLFTWGLHMDRSKDIFEMHVPVQVQSPPIEEFTMLFKAAPYGTDLLMAWDNVKAILPVKVIL